MTLFLTAIIVLGPYLMMAAILAVFAFIFWVFSGVLAQAIAAQGLRAEDPSTAPPAPKEPTW